MGFTLKAYLVSGLVFLIPGHFLSAGTIDQNSPEITIFVYNTARVSLPDLSVAEQQASMIFRQTGVVTAWVNCSVASLKGPCRPSGPSQFILHIVAHGKTSNDAVFGVAFRGADGTGGYWASFLNRV